MFYIQKKAKPSRANRLVLERAGEVALGEVVLDRTLLGCSSLCECNGSTERSGSGSVLELGDTDTGGTGDGSRADGSGWHLDGDWEIHGGCGGETTDADTWDVLGDLSGLEGSGISSSGGGINRCGQWASTILVDLVEGHLDGSILSGSWHTGCGTSTSCGLDGSLLGSGWGLDTASGSTNSEGALEEGSGVDLTGSNDIGAVGVSSHEEGDHLGGVNWSSGSSAESRGFGGSELFVTDDGGIGLRSAAWGCAITGSSVSNGKSWHGYTVGTDNGVNDTVCEDIGGGEGHEDDC